MKHLSALILLYIILTSCAQTETEYEENKLTINIETVDQIYIAGYCSPMDSCRGTSYLLNDTMTENLIDVLNKSVSKDPCNFNDDYLEYLLYIHFKDGSKRDFKIIGKSIKDDNDLCFEIDDNDFFEKVWTELDKECIELNAK